MAHAERAAVQAVVRQNGAPIERRREPRFDLPLSCLVSQVSGERAEFSGTVINMSRSGILLCLDPAWNIGALRPHSVVRVSVDLPRHPSFSPRSYEFTATVVRIDAAEAQTRVAFEIRQADQYEA
jgi:c-di-GMP-binding flagellar brake protein YcgR